MRSGRYLALISAAALIAAAAGNQGSELPEGKGKAILLRACVGCHEMDTVTGSRYTESGWRRTADDMVSRGAEGSEQEIADVVAYLTKYFGKVNVNKAAAAQLREALGLSDKEAQAIVAYREQNGEFKNLDQLKAVPGINTEQIQAKVAVVAFRD
jgi:competence protein ComEA